MKRAQVADRERRLRADVRMKAGERAGRARATSRVTDELLERQPRGPAASSRSACARGARPPLEENLLLVEVNRLEASRALLESRVEVLTLQLKALAGLATESPLSLAGRPASAPASARPRRRRSRRRSPRGRTSAWRGRRWRWRGRRSGRKQAEGRWDASVNVGYQRQDFGFGLSGITDAAAHARSRTSFTMSAAA